MAVVEAVQNAEVPLMVADRQAAASALARSPHADVADARPLAVHALDGSKSTAYAPWQPSSTM